MTAIQARMHPAEASLRAGEVVRCHVRALAQRDAAELSAIANNASKVRITAAELKY
ncbi:MAG TPA: hypothetical protein VLM11_13305 [Streptosporangiaceae bacterium]|nr:hypothetical protein [Streptosporangiaceae bacterium]